MSRRAAKYQLRKEASDPVSERRQKDLAIFKTANNDIIPFHATHTLAPTKVIDLFLENFKYILSSENLQEMIQQVKGDLFKRDYLSAFDSDDKRYAYVARWTPARALAYLSLFASLRPIRTLFEDPERRSRVLCVGGGAASELVGLGSVFCSLKQQCGGSPSDLTVDVIDIADWLNIVHNLSGFMKNNWLYDSLKLNATFTLGDVLTKTAEELSLPELDLITLLFTTNELFCEQKTDTIKFLQLLSANCRKGSLLLITESAGSYSHITVGLKQFPVQFLIDAILVGRPGAENGAWTIVDQSESCWYRINDKEVKYPVKLENMRFFYRLYQKK